MQLTLNIEDRNDNPPEFSHEKYEARLHENQLDFSSPLFIEAFDADLNGMYFRTHVIPYGTLKIVANILNSNITVSNLKKYFK